MTQWQRSGLIFAPEAQRPWMQTHAALPVVDQELSQLIFSSRDAQGRSWIGAAPLSLDPVAVGSPWPQPLLEPGALGAFDDAGVTSSCLVHSGGRVWLYYTGWALGVSVPFYLYAGLAVSDDGRRFERVSPGPLLERSAVDPYLTASPWVMIDAGIWRMWYVSGTRWESSHGRVRHRYHIKYAESRDGVAWTREGRVSIDYASDEEYAFGRPCVIRDGGIYRMWYSFRGEYYRLGYAESSDGISWTRKDADAGLAPAAEGWDAEMITYPAVFQHAGRLHMLYNGNGYGRDGIGLAVEA